MEEIRNLDPSVIELLHADEYTPEELSELTGIGAHVIRRAVFDGTLPARMVEHDIISIPRDAVIQWMKTRDQI